MRRRLAAIGALAAALMLAGCQDATPLTATPSIPASAVPTTPAPSVPPASDEPSADVSCETIIPAQTVTDFESVGWSAQQEPFVVGETMIDGGLLCKWGDFDVASDRLQIFGWGPATAEQSQAAQDQLLASGWRVLTADEAGDDAGTYVTESTDTATVAGSGGYGFTYLFGDGWITFADTREGLLLIERPGSE